MQVGEECQWKDVGSTIMKETLDPNIVHYNRYLPIDLRGGYNEDLIRSTISAIT